MAVIVFLILLTRFLDDLVVGIGKARRLGDDLVVIAFFSQLSLRHVFGVTAQHDIGTAARHVGGDGDRAELTCLRDDLRLFLVVLGVQDIVLDTGFLQ